MPTLTSKMSDIHTLRLPRFNNYCDSLYNNRATNAATVFPQE